MLILLKVYHVRIYTFFLPGPTMLPIGEAGRDTVSIQYRLRKISSVGERDAIEKRAEKNVSGRKIVAERLEVIEHAADSERLYGVGK